MEADIYSSLVLKATREIFLPETLSICYGNCKLHLSESLRSPSVGSIGAYTTITDNLNFLFIKQKISRRLSSFLIHHEPYSLSLYPILLA